MTLRVVTVKMPEELLERIDRIALREGRARSELIREALEFWLSSQEVIRAPRVYRVRIY